MEIEITETVKTQTSMLTTERSLLDSMNMVETKEKTIVSIQCKSGTDN